jgi:hypothetical protein
VKCQRAIAYYEYFLIFNLLKYVASAQLPRQKDTILFVVARNVADSSVSIAKDRMLASRVHLQLCTPDYVKYSIYTQNYDLLIGEG